MKALPLALAVAGTLLLAACATNPPRSPEQAQCDREAEDDPAVEALRVKILGNSLNIYQDNPELVRATKRAAMACMRRHGFAPKGGVELPALR